MKEGVKTTIIVVLISIVAILSLVLSFVIGKKYADMKNDALYGKKEYQLVGDVFSGIRYFNWPEDIMKKIKYFDPDTLYHKVEIPEILIETETTKLINEKIYNNYSKYVEDIKNKGKSYITYEIDIDYTYKVKNDILFLMIDQNINSSKSSSEQVYTVYYYDIKNDKELNVQEVCNLFEITLNQIDDVLAKEIYAVMPNSLTHFDVYYNQNEPCSSNLCKSETVIRNIG